TIILVIDKTDGGTEEISATATGASGSTISKKLIFTTASLTNTNLTDTNGIQVKADSLSFATGDLTGVTSTTDVNTTFNTITLNNSQVDTSIPIAPSNLALADEDNSGLKSDNTTNHTNDLTITGEAEAGTTVQLYNADTAITGASATVDNDGRFSIDITLSNNTNAHNITAKTTDAVGYTSVASTVLAITVDTTAPTQSIGSIRISTDTGTANNFITNTATQTLTATLSAVLSADEKLYYRLDGVANTAGEVTDWIAVAASNINDNAVSIAGVTLIAGADKKIAFKVTDAASNENTVVEQAYMLDTTIPDAVDLSTNNNIQNTSRTIANTTQINTGIAFDASIQTPTTTDIKTIKVVLAGAGLNTTHDKLVLDSALTLDTDIATVTDKTIGSVSGLEYNYIANTKTWTISKTLGNLTVNEAKTIIESLKLKNTDIESQIGTRTATISYIDAANNESTPATASLRIELHRGFTINGEQAADLSGKSVSNAGDVNGDGLGDLLIGAWGANGNKGSSYVVFGKTDNPSINLSELANSNSTNGFAIVNNEITDGINGFAVSNAGDVNGDGLADIIIGAYNANLGDKDKVGKSYVVFGKADNAVVNLSAIIAGTGGYVIHGEATNDFSGYSVSSAGDVNGDGLSDLIVGAIGVNTRAGKSYVVFGRENDSTAIHLSNIASGTGGFAINGETNGDSSGYSVSAGDVNGDGLDDLIIGTRVADGNKGKAYVVFGKVDGSTVDLNTIASGTGGFIVHGGETRDHTGNSVSYAGDVNGDGLDDLIIGASGVDFGGENAGASYVVFGKTNAKEVLIDDVINGSAGFVIRGNGANDRSGHSVAFAGDVNGDGLDDLIIGVETTHSNKAQGHSYVVFGKTGVNAIELQNIANGTGGFVINGATAGDYSGDSVSYAGDVNGDGLDDLIVSAHGADEDKGKSYVVFGKVDTNAIDLSKLKDGSKYAIDFKGTKGNETLTGANTIKNEIFVAGDGNDTLIGNGGMDVFNAGNGNDIIELNKNNVTALGQKGAGNRTRVDGGGGVDMLRLNETNITLDFTRISHGRVKGIEVIDITGVGGVNTLVLSLENVIEMSDSSNILKVYGANDDIVKIASGDWEKTPGKTIQGFVTYDIWTAKYAHTDLGVALWIDQDLKIKDAAIGTPEDDTIVGSGGDDTISGGKGKDHILGGNGNDTLSGGEGEDYL
ncbi:MAG: hypothetical protein FE834_10790, partial [Gammaproteobacteria bacterium]|nr:hypothetical protein [Gammaproteobacteria bacterium]